jgi:hypothetical protein
MVQHQIAEVSTMVWKAISAYGGWVITVGLGSYMTVTGLAPPLTGFSSSAWVVDQQHVSAEIGAWDLKSCHYVKGSAVGYAGENNAWWKVDMNVGPHGPPLGEPGWRSLGRWSWGRPELYGNVSEVRAELTIVCGKDPPSKILVGPFDVHR